MLIDGGPDRSVLAKLGRRMPVTDRTIEFLVLTHPHADHYSGLIPVLGRYRVRTIIMTRAIGTSPAFRDFIRALDEEHAATHTARAGDVIEFEPGIRFTVLAADALPTDDPNDASVVMRMVSPLGSVLFAGDATAAVEDLLLASDAPLRSDILKVGHHGSRYSSSPDFLRAVAPREAVIEVGRNTYGHPSSAALSRLKALGIRVWRTDQDGDIRAAFGRSGIMLRSRR